jgi:hypothetical protein
MSRFGPAQPDLFAASPPKVSAAPEPAPAEVLAALLQQLRAAERLPWADAAAAMAAEHRALGLARLAGEDGERLAAAILAETERLFAAAERDAIS